jgi:retron-type reverse transcriptase
LEEFTLEEISERFFRLQKRVFQSSFSWRQPKARYLQKLILKSKAARYLAIRQVTQLNAGKKTAGVDGKASLTFEERFNLSEELRTTLTHEAQQAARNSQSLKRTEQCVC